jgi:hypothetical protein
MACVFCRATSLGLRRRRKSDHRTLFRRGASRALRRFRPGDRDPQAGCDRHRNQSGRDDLRGGDQHNTDRCVHAGSPERGSGHQPQPTRRQPHRHHPRSRHRDLGEAPGDAQRSDPLDSQRRGSGYARGVGRFFRRRSSASSPRSSSNGRTRCWSAGKATFTRIAS